MRYHKQKPEPIQPGNPHKLVRYQHIFPKASIERFSHPRTGITAVLTNENRRISNTDSKNKLFCANRVWDQRAEAGFMAAIESEFQFLADRLIRGDQLWMDLKGRAITRFFALWELRAHYAQRPEPAAKFQGGRGMELSQDLREHLESKHALFLDNDGTMSSRHVTGMQIQFRIDHRVFSLGALRWRLCKAAPDAGEFLVPDQPGGLYIPLTPTLALLGASDIDIARSQVMRVINSHALACSSRFVIAHDLSRCFIAREHSSRLPPVSKKLKWDLFPNDCELANSD